MPQERLKMSTIYLPAEVFRRELIPRTVLATYLSLKGFPVIFGHRWYVTNYALANAKEGDVFFLSHTFPDRDLNLYSSLLDKKVKFIGVEEEAVFDSLQYEDQLSIRSQGPGDFSLLDLWLCWGNRDFQVLAQRLLRSNILRKYGTPRSALLGQIGKDIFSNEIMKEIFPAYGNFVLVATSFAPTSLSHRKAILDLHANNPAFDLQRFERDDSIVNNRTSLEKHHIAIKEILKSTTLNIVLRPYINEGDVFTQGLVNSLNQSEKKRVFVDRRPFAFPLLAACKALIHSGSTLGIESRAIGKKTIALNYFLNRDPLENEDKLSTHISDCPKNERALLDSIASVSEDNRIYIDSIIANADTSNFYENLYQDLFNLGCEKLDGNMMVNLRPARRSKLYRFATKLRRGPIYRYDLEKRPRYGINAIMQIITSSQKVFDLNQKELKLRKIERDTYLLH
jgi:surface carbohydrate biosynthesis protein